MDTNTHELLCKDSVYQVVGVAMDVLNTLGHGLLEKPYENALVVEFGVRNIAIRQQQRFDVLYDLFVQRSARQRFSQTERRTAASSNTGFATSSHSTWLILSCSLLGKRLPRWPIEPAVWPNLIIVPGLPINRVRNVPQQPKTVLIKTFLAEPTA